jgi:hypothetical protein
VHNAIQKTADKIRDEFGESPELEPGLDLALGLEWWSR